MYNVAIYDDSKEIQANVIEILKERYKDELNLITAAKAPDLISSASVIDILLMDINLGKKKQNGIEIAERIKDNNKDCQVIFISGYNDYAQDIFEANPVFFIRKPIEEEILIKAVDLAIENVNKSRTERFCYQRESRVYIVPIQDIIYFESSRRIIKIVSNSGTDVFYSRLNDIESTISGDFIRIHQSYLVNPRYIASLNGNEIYLTNGVKLPVSKPRLANVKEELLRIFAEKM
ncbi:MAG: LytTR family DNA-binding domain-containing protein [Saccharofermentans sp.]|nr:LytTR family DNA-binding domain-containing protein [Saccharofermentans sp.]